MVLSINHLQKLTLFLYFTSIFVTPLTVSAQYEDGHNNFQTASGRFVTAVVLLITTMIVAVIFVVLSLCCKSQDGRRVPAENGRPGYRANKGLDPSVIESFPVFKYSDVEARRQTHSDPLECAVCLSPFEPDEKLRLLPKCNHVFHVECLDPWLKDHSTCPLCRIDLVPETDEMDRVEPGNGPAGEVYQGRNDVDDMHEVRVDIEEGHIRKYKRWNSTGHVAEADRAEGECWKRFTLMLPEKEIMKFGEVTNNKFKRTRSSI